MNPDSTDLENRSRTAETLRESENYKELVWKNITLWVDTHGRSRRWDAQKLRKDSRVLWIREKAKALRCGLRSDRLDCMQKTSRGAAGMSRIVRLAAIVSSSDDGCGSNSRILCRSFRGSNLCNKRFSI
jgi:hypothetical protein